MKQVRNPSHRPWPLNRKFHKRIRGCGIGLRILWGAYLRVECTRYYLKVLYCFVKAISQIQIDRIDRWPSHTSALVQMSCGALFESLLLLAYSVVVFCYQLFATLLPIYFKTLSL